jgi:hypothetical protein
VFQGTWLIGVTYATGDAVFFNGSSYISLSGGNTGNTPPAAPWALLAQQGATGGVGPKGSTGSTGSTGPAGPPVVFQGTWLIGVTYATGDAVFFNGSSYISLSGGNTGNTPPAAPWALLAQQGATGPAGTTRGWGTVSSAGVLSANASSVTSVGHASAGKYCIAVTGATPSADAITATVDWAHDTSGTTQQAYAEVSSSASDCAAGRFEVLTFTQTVSGGALNNVLADQGFEFVIG